MAASRLKLAGIAMKNLRLSRCIPWHIQRSRYSSEALAEPKQDIYQKFTPGTYIHGYKVDQIERVDELNLDAIVLTHEKTGARHLHIAREDSNNAFGVAFRTTPMNSTGVPHILEHTALCGSQKFPVRDPFFKMINRSLSTFMNAMTASDWTVYPFSSQNKADYRNLLSVYLDAAFFPLLREPDFRQEGWRLEHENIEDKNSPLIFKGIVFNEMKGVFSSQQSVFEEAGQSNLLPDHTYGNCSGGLPSDIPNLTWKQLRDFHANHYHPSNARFITYGDSPLEEHLNFINSEVLIKFDKLEFNTEVPKQTRWTEPRTVNITCQHNKSLPNPDKQTSVAISYLLSDIRDIYESSVLSLICSLLVSGASAPFYQSLIESQIGSGYAPLCGHEKSTRDTWFSVGLEGIHENDVNKVTEIIDQTFQKLAKDGLPESRVEALLSQIELGMKHQTPKFGLNLLIGLTTSWNHEADPIDSLQVTSILEKFKQRLKLDPHYVQKFIQKYFIDNKHKLTLIMTPDPEHDSKLQTAENEKLNQLVHQLTDDERTSIYQKGLELAKTQNTVEDVSCLPSLQITDINRELIRTKLEFTNTNDVSIQLCEQPTNGVVYFNMLSDSTFLPAHLQSFLPLFCGIINKMGAGSLDYKEQSEEIKKYTGGLGVSTHISTNPTNLKQYEQGVHIGSFCLEENIDKMFQLWTDIFNSITLEDVERVIMLMRMSAADLVNSISQSGHRYAMTHSASYLSEQNRLNEVLNGMTQVSFIKQIVNDKPDPVLGYLKDIALHLLNKDAVRCSLNAEPRFMSSAVNSLNSFLSVLNGTCNSSLEHTTCRADELYTNVNKTFFPMDFTVNYSGISIPTVHYTHSDFASLRVMSRLLTNKYLHREIREKGGAYGGGCSGGSPGTMSFYSYRDPNSTQTLDVMKNSFDWLMNYDITETDVNEAILAIFQQIDEPVAPGSRGGAHFLSRITDDMKQKHREEVLSVNSQSIRQTADRYLRHPAREGTTLIGPDNEEIRNDNSWTVNSGDGSITL